MKIQNNFVQAKMNKDIDERLLPSGQYPHAENIRVANSDGSDVGAIENVKGNKALTNLVLTNAVTIGSYSDGSNQKLYWFVTSDEKDLVLEFAIESNTLSVLLESTKPNGVLKFSTNHLITGVNKVINGDSSKDLLIWTDNLNGIRKINIERAKTYGVNGFTEEDISLIKNPPRFAPKTTLTYSGLTTENSIEDKFLSFSYRYKYLDGEYSALSSYTNYNFNPNPFRLDYQTMENEGMVNSYNAVKVDFNTGGRNVSAVQLIVKETNSNALAIIETFDKTEEGWANDESRSFTFSNSKKYIFLPERELFRAYDNVPRFAKAMEMIKNRLVFGNYVEGYDLTDVFGTDINTKYNLELISKTLTGSKLPLVLTTTSSAEDSIRIDFTGSDLKIGSSVSLFTVLKTGTYSKGKFDNIFNYLINENFSNSGDMAVSPDFKYFVEVVMTDIFIANYEATPPVGAAVASIEGFKVSSWNTNTITVKAPVITYNSSSLVIVEEYAFTGTSESNYREIASNTSLKTNRSYEVGLIYLDSQGRATTVITSKNNTIKVPQKFSTNQNKIKLTLTSPPPAFADRYKVVVKQNKAEYQTIYTNIFYEDGLYRWVKLEGANKDKVQEGDTLIVKSDLGGAVSEIVKVRVLEISLKDKDFLSDNEDPSGELIIEEAGLYMKIKPTGFDMNFTDTTARTFEGSSHLRYPQKTYTTPALGDYVGSVFTPYEVKGGSTITLNIKFNANGSIAYNEEYEKTFRVNSDYPSLKVWFETEVRDLGQFGRDFTRSGAGGDANNYGSGYGFEADGSRFWVRAHRDGTATRKIGTNVSINAVFSEGTVIFETEAKETDNNIFYETEQTFEIINNYHQGNVQNQNVINGEAIIEVDFFNCYVQGNGAESYRYKDAFNKPFLNIDLRPTSTSIEKYKEVRKYADLTYSAGHNENTNLNGLNEFNLSTANFKDDVDKRYGHIQKLYSKDTDLILFQEDKVSRVLYEKDLLMNADGTSNLSSVEYVLGQQVPYTGEYGISRNPESFAVNANSIYFTDARRGAVCRLGLDGVTEISKAGMSNYFNSLYRDSIDSKKFGAYDPFYDQYVLHNSDGVYVEEEEEEFPPNEGVNCEVSAWGDWSACSLEGRQTRTRTIVVSPTFGGTACPVLTETRDCTPPVGCEVSEWSEWSTCSVEGSQTRTRTVITQPEEGGVACPVLTETRECTQLAFEPTWVGSEPYCETENIVINKFDNLVVRFLWDYPSAGSDLDIQVRYENNNTPSVDNIFVGYGGASTTVPANTAPETSAYLWWGLDDRNLTGDPVGIEGVLVNIKKFITDFPNSPNEIKVGLYAVWYGGVVSGDFRFEVTTYLGGTMSKQGFDIINTGGTLVSNDLRNLNTMINNSSASPQTSYKVGTLTYNKTTDTAILSLS